VLSGGLRPGRGQRLAAALSGAALVTSSALTRFGIFEAGRASARDPKYTVRPQRERLRQRAANGERPGDAHRPGAHTRGAAPAPPGD
ncbi:MAG TPA: hypothetical protein VIP48_01105, partial [Streptosporangiaceae bacterium]